MYHRYCICCQLRLGSNSSLYFKITDVEMIQKINEAKPLILKHFKRNNNNQVAEIGVQIHKKCSLRVNSNTTITKVNLNNTISNDCLNFTENNELNCCNEGDGENKRDHFNDNNDNSNDNEPTQTSFDDLNNTGIEFSSKESIRLKLSKGYSSHQYCFVCRSNQKRIVTVQSDARYEIFSKKNIFIIKGSIWMKKDLY
jgi:hypothetical protein